MRDDRIFLNNSAGVSITTLSTRLRYNPLIL
jgi:hypothetical protein